MVYLDRLQKRPGRSRSLSRWLSLAPGVGGHSMSRRQKTDGRGLECIDQKRGAIVVHGYTALGPRGNHWIDGSSWPQLAVSIRGCQPQQHTSPAVRRTCLIKRSTSAIGLLCRSSVTATAEDPAIFFLMHNEKHAIVSASNHAIVACLRRGGHRGPLRCRGEILGQHQRSNKAVALTHRSALTKPL